MNAAQPGSTLPLSLRLRAVLLVAVATPVVYMLTRGLLAGRNVAYMDDIDGALMLLVRLHEGGSWTDLLRWIFEVNNEHRMVTSRLLHVASHALTGTVNFAVVGLIGNLFLCGLCAVLIRTAGTGDRKWTMALLLAGVLFQLQHFENFFWSGSSIDHFQVVLLVASSLVLLARGGWGAWLGAGVFAVLAMFTLAHGLVVWPIGALVLAVERRWRSFAAWLALGAAASLGFFAGFEFNPAHQVGDFSAAGVTRIVRYWLALLGAPLALGKASLAPVFGVMLLVMLGWLLKAGAFKRERIALSLMLWAITALALVAIGRVNFDGGVLGSRYYVLAALAWALSLFAALQHGFAAARPDRRVLWLLPGLIAFNLAADLAFAGPARRWVEERDRAVADFERHGRDGAGPTTLHPLPAHSTRVIRQAEELGVFVMPRTTEDRAFLGIRTDAKFSWAVDRVAVDENLVTIDGWAAIAGRAARPGEVHVVLRTKDAQRVLTTAAVPRPDVAAAFPGERWHDAGFHFSLRRSLLPADDYQLGILVPTGEGGAEMVMTPRRVDLQSGDFLLETDKVAPNRAIYDELLPRSPASTVRAAPKKYMRVSFFDPRDVLIHVDFSGAGEMAVTLAEASPLDPPPRNQGRAVAYMKGSAAIAITGADESTNIAIFAARRQPKRGVSEKSARGLDGFAHIASLSIVSRNGRFGGVRTGNVHYSSHTGITGIRAPGVRFSGPIAIGNITAFASAMPEIELGFARDTRITGGDLRQPNGQPVRVSGVWRLRFVEGRTARGLVLPAQPNRARLVNNGRDVSARIAGERPAASGKNLRSAD